MPSALERLFEQNHGALYVTAFVDDKWLARLKVSSWRLVVAVETHQPAPWTIEAPCRLHFGLVEVLSTNLYSPFRFWTMDDRYARAARDLARYADRAHPAHLIDVLTWAKHSKFRMLATLHMWRPLGLDKKLGHLDAGYLRSPCLSASDQELFEDPDIALAALSHHDASNPLVRHVCTRRIGKNLWRDPNFVREAAAICPATVDFVDASFHRDNQKEVLSRGFARIQWKSPAVVVVDDDVDLRSREDADPRRPSYMSHGASVPQLHAFLLLTLGRTL